MPKDAPPPGVIHADGDLTINLRVVRDYDRPDGTGDRGWLHLAFDVNTTPGGVSAELGVEADGKGATVTLRMDYSAADVLAYQIGVLAAALKPGAVL